MNSRFAHDEMGAARCLLCQSRDVSEVDRIQTHTLIDAWRQLYGIDVEEELGDCKSIALYRCHSCGFQYFQPSTAAGSPSLYAQLCKMDWYYGAEKWEHDVALRDIEGATKIIEIGCGSGEFIARARDEKGLPVEGLEQNPEAVEGARRRGLLVSAGDVREIALERPAGYDVVCSFQVLEHVPVPRDFLDSCLALLRPGGKLLLGLPNSRSFLRYQFNLLDLPPHHMSRWDAHIVRELPSIFPLRLRTLRFEPLARNHVCSYLDTHVSRLRPASWGRPSRVPRLLSLLSVMIIRSGVRRFLLGQTLYASFTRI
jgi:SAM-dependent methyltransferase